MQTIHEYFMKQIANLTWNININRKTINNDQKMLDEVQQSLNNLVKEYESMTGERVL